MTYSTRRPAVGVPGRLLLPTFAGMRMIEAPNASAQSLSGNNAYYLPFTPPYDTGLLSVSYYNQSGTAGVDLGIYDDAGNRLASSTPTASSAGAVNTWTPSSPVALAAGARYWIGYGNASGGPTVLALSGSATQTQIAYMKESFAATLPSTWTPTAGVANSPIPVVAVVFTT